MHWHPAELQQLHRQWVGGSVSLGDVCRRVSVHRRCEWLWVLYDWDCRLPTQAAVDGGGRLGVGRCGSVPTQYPGC
jgi:hypothetical protein